MIPADENGTPGLEDHYRSDLSRLPDSDRIAFSVRDSRHGLRVVYDDGAVLEFAVAGVADAATFGGSPQRVVLDRQHVAEALLAGRAQPDEIDDLTHFRLFISLVLIGVGRARRGEELSGGQLVRTWAAEHLIRLLRRYPPSDDSPRQPDRSGEPDPFNPWRRWETAHPALGAALGSALAQRCEPCGLRLLDLAEEHLPGRWPGYAAADMRVVRRALATSERPRTSPGRADRRPEA